jgi:hypothetical protein
MREHNPLCNNRKECYSEIAGLRRRMYPKNSIGIVVLSKDVLLVERDNCGLAYNFSRFSIH